MDPGLKWERALKGEWNLLNLEEEWNLQKNGISKENGILKNRILTEERTAMWIQGWSGRLVW